MNIIIPFKTPTINHLYGQHGFRKYLKPDAVKLRKEIIDICKNLVCSKGKLKVEVNIHENWYTKKEKVKIKDIANREKFLIDSIFKALKIDDKMIFKHTMEKIQDTKEYAIVNIQSYLELNGSDQT